MCSDTVCAPELSAWRLINSVITNVLGSSAECEIEIDELLKKYLQLGSRMSFKMHFL